MRRRTRVEITIETSLLVVRRGTSQTNAWCAECVSPVRSVTPEESAVLAGVSQRIVFRWLEVGLLHLSEMAASSRLTWLNSVLRSIDNGGSEVVLELVTDHRNQPPIR